MGQVVGLDIVLKRVLKRVLQRVPERVLEADPAASERSYLAMFLIVSLCDGASWLGWTQPIPRIVQAVAWRSLSVDGRSKVASSQQV